MSTNHNFLKRKDSRSRMEPKMPFCLPTNGEGQSHKTVSTNHNLFEKRRERRSEIEPRTPFCLPVNGEGQLKTQNSVHKPQPFQKEKGTPKRNRAKEAFRPLTGLTITPYYTARPNRLSLCLCQRRKIQFILISFCW